MALHFDRGEYLGRQAKARAKMAELRLDGLLIFRQESMYYLTGYDTSGYSMFQGMYFGADGALALLTRSADRLQAKITSIISDVRIWTDREGANPAHDLRDMLESHGCRGKRLGIEYHAYGLTAQRGKLVDAALDGFCRLVDASDLVRLLRLVKSPAEIEYFRRAGELTDGALAISREQTLPGAHTNAIYGDMLCSMLNRDGDPSAGRWPVGAGEEALLVRYHTGHAPVAPRDQVQFEIAGSYRHYHTALMYVILTGKTDPRHQRMFEACAETLTACEAVLRPGRTIGEIFEAHASTFTKLNFGDCYLNACGYTMGATYPPTWMDFPMIVRGGTDVIEPNMVFFMHMILLDQATGLSMSLGETALATAGPCERLTHAPAALIVN